MVNPAEKVNLFKSSSDSRVELYQWVLQWFFRKKEQDISKKPDISTLVTLLQIIGFKLEHFEKKDNRTVVDNNPIQKEEIHITIECGTSKMAAILKMNHVPCSCLDNEKVKDGSFWSVVGTGPMGSIENMIDETGSDLLPVISKERSSVLRDVLFKVFDLINNESNDTGEKKPTGLQKINTSPKKSDSPASPLVRSYTDINDPNYIPLTVSHLRPNLENLKLNDSKSLMDMSEHQTPKMKREGTYDKSENSIGEPRPSPRKAPSPMELDFTDMETSFDQLSMNIDESVGDNVNENLTKAIMKAHLILDKAISSLNLIKPPKKLPLSSSLLSVVDCNDNFVKPNPLMSSSFYVQPKPQRSNVSVNSIPAPVSRINRYASNSNLLNRSLAHTSINKNSPMNKSVCSFIPTLATKTAIRPGSAPVLPSKLQRPSRISTPGSKVIGSKLATMREASNSPAKTPKLQKTIAATATATGVVGTPRRLSSGITAATAKKLSTSISTPGSTRRLIGITKTSLLRTSAVKQSLTPSKPALCSTIKN